MTITDSRPSELIRIALEFMRPVRSTSTAEFTFTLAGSHTAATRSMAGPRHFIAKAIGLFMNMDTMIGDKFEEGLANLKSMTETPRLERSEE